MKYLKLYEEYLFDLWEEPITFKKWLSQHIIQIPSDNIKSLNLQKENITTLKGIGKLKTLVDLNCSDNLLKDLKGIEELTNLTELICSENQLTNLKGIEKITTLRQLFCSDNNLKNLDEIKNLPNLRLLYSGGNPFEEPIPIEIVNKFGKVEIYGRQILFHEDSISFGTSLKSLYIRFRGYDFQKKFLTEHPDRVKDLEPFGYAKGIKEEFPALFRGKEWGFFDLERSEK